MVVLISSYSWNGLPLFFGGNLAEQRVIGRRDPGKGFVENGGRKSLARFREDLTVEQGLGFGLVTVNPVGQIDVGADPVLDQVGMGPEEFGIHDEQADDELSVGPQTALIYEEPAVALMNQAR